MRPQGRPVRETAVGVAGALAILVGTLLAVQFVPDNPRASHAMFPAGACLSIALLLPVALRVRARRMMSLLRAENLLMFGLVYWLLLDIMQDAFELDVSATTASLAIAAIGIAGATIWLAAHLGVGRLPDPIQRELRAQWTPRWIFRASIACFALGMSAFAIPVRFDVIELFSYFGASRWSAPWMRGQLGGIDAFWDHLQYFGYALPTLYVAYARERGWLGGRALLILAMAALLIAFLALGGGRRIVGVAVGAGILCWVMGADRIRAGALVGVSIASAGLLYLLQVILLQRGIGYLEKADDPAGWSRLHIDDNILRLAQAIEIVPAEHPYVHFQQILYILVRPIPRLFWPGKPTDPGFDLSSLVGSQGVSLSMSMIGESYIAFGFAGIVAAGLVFGVLCGLVNQMVRMRRPDANPALVPISLMVLFVGIRSLQDLVIMSYAVLSWLVVSAIANRLGSRRSPPGAMPPDARPHRWPSNR